MSNFSSLGASVEFAENPEPRCPCLLLLDNSASMRGKPSEALNQGIRSFRDHLVKDTLAARRVEIAIVSFNSEVVVVQDFVTVDQFEPPVLKADGLTFMATGILKGLNMLKERKAQYRTNGISYFRPLTLMITDGGPQGEPDNTVVEAFARIRADEENKRVAFYAVGVEGANMTLLQQLAVRPPVLLQGLDFTEMFHWLSASMQSVAQSGTDTQIPMPTPGKKAQP